MSNLVFYLLIFFFTLWLGYYLIARDMGKPVLLLTGYSLGFYAAGIFFEVLQATSPPELSRIFSYIPNIFLFLPALLWTGILIQLLPAKNLRKTRLFRIWLLIILPLAFLSLLVASLFGFSPLLVTSSIILLPLAGVYGYLLIRDRHTLTLSLIATAFYILAYGFSIHTIWLPRWLVILSLGLPLILLGIGIAIYDARSNERLLWPDLARSLAAAIFLALLFGIQLALVIILETRLTFSFIVLAFSLTATITFLATFSGHLRKWFNKLIPDRD